MRAGGVGVRHTSQSRTEFLSFSVFVCSVSFVSVSFSLSSSPQINPSIFLFSNIRVVGFHVSCWCLPPVPRNPHVSRHVETETPRRAVVTGLRQAYRLLCYLRFLCPGITGVCTEGSCHQTCARWGRGQVHPALQHGGEGADWGSQSRPFPRLSGSSGACSSLPPGLR